MTELERLEELAGHGKMNRYDQLQYQLLKNGTGYMRCAGNSMKPVLQNPSWCTYERRDKYDVGDIVFCKVKGRYIDAHFITKIGPDGRYMIANNHGHENGWTKTIYGKVVQAQTIDGQLIYKSTT